MRHGQILSVFEQKQEIEIDGNKLKYMANFGIPSSQYFLLSTEEKSKMLKIYYSKNLSAYFGDGKI